MGVHARSSVWKNRRQKALEGRRGGIRVYPLPPGQSVRVVSLAFADVKTKFSHPDRCSYGGSTILIRIKAAAWQINKITACSLVKQSIGPLRSPGKFPRPFIRPSKQIRRLLASLLYNGQASFPTLLPFSGAGKFSLSAHSVPYAKLFTHNFFIKRHKLAFMWMWISYY